MERITVVLADDNVIVREGVRTLLQYDDAVEVVGVAADFDETVDAVSRLAPQVLVTDIRMPPHFQSEGIDAAKEARRRLPGIGVVVLSQYDDPEYAMSLLTEGRQGFAYLLKERIGDGNRLGRAVREVAAGGTMLDPEIVAALVSPASRDGDLTQQEDELLRLIAQGRPLKAVAATRGCSLEAVNHEVEAVFLKLAQQASSGRSDALRRLRLLQQAIADREMQGETLSRLLPGGLAEKLRADGADPGQTERLTVTVLMSDVRGYSGISEHTDAAVLAGQLNAHRREMNSAILSFGGTVMHYGGDSVIAVFGAPFPQHDHATQAVAAAAAMHERQALLDAEWAAQGLAPFGLGIGVSTGEVVAALLGSEDRLEYTVVGDTVNLAQRLQDLARPGGTTVVSDTTVAETVGWTFEPMLQSKVKGRDKPVRLSRVLGRATTGGTA
jgi:adenylate cyclase